MSKRMRPTGRDEGFQKLRTMRCFNEVYERILAGWSMPELARFIQEDRNEYGQATRPGLVQVLQRFRDTIPPATLAKRVPSIHQEAKVAADDGIDELKEFEKLFRMQMERIQIDVTNEKNIGTLMPKMTQEMRVAGELLGKIADLKMDLGVNTRQLGQVDAVVTIQNDVGKYGKESVKKVMENPEKRRKVLNMAERILALPSRTDKAAVAVVTEEDAAEAELIALGMLADDEEHKDEPT